MRRFLAALLFIALGIGSARAQMQYQPGALGPAGGTLLGPLTIGGPSENALTLNPGATSGAAATLGVTGTGGITSAAPLSLTVRHIAFGGRERFNRWQSHNRKSSDVCQFHHRHRHADLHELTLHRPYYGKMGPGADHRADWHVLRSGLPIRDHPCAT